MTSLASKFRLPQERTLRTALPGPRSEELAARRRAAVAAGVGSSVPVYAVDADGGVIVDVDGNSLIDFGAGIAVTTVGASDPDVAAAVAAQAARFTHTCFMVTPYEDYVAVAEKLNALTPGDHEKRSVLFNSGAEAVENAVKIARTATGRDAVVAFDNAYHGRTLLTMALTAKTMPYKAGFGPFAPEVYRMPMSYPYRDPLGDDGVAAARRAITQIENQIGAKSLAAIIIEPIQGEGGFIVPAPGFLQTLVDWARENGVVFIADEVQTGFARTGSWFACDHEGIVPDLITMAKGIAGGMPLAAVTGRAELLDSVHTGGLGGTYGGNPVACAAALAALDVMERDDLSGRARAINDRVTTRLSALADEVGVIGEIRGRGAMIAVELVKPGTTEPDPVLTKAIAAAALAQGVVILTCGTHGNVIRLLPPLVIGDELLDEGLTVLEDAIRAAAA
ncbi:MAG TPA: 4-aminobutyrate--2-oxoglutarate transaminase [Gordonia sp. (in: high G+C Gram-positive bacteria)]|uniref:4-aminobutyrate--2-oxoglutarate transaminase n=1 Tax=unclassified Gordonia (in: high G+C Gram-positive bacteria) TaxID=2657482 RepID=UPI000FB297CC|nr:MULTISPECIES: 4-aminobutyrate--2-oxoglutarate transaminase [unclassified Gordonia (in: high G+C Gram-positive bacteria)]RUP38629.1 MAG: 4-aminobutyrate--2-oxoglutarate transaminase [Gordonia sp. (in: high G+C Gram-positive bacteria)]HNP56241.1 4-aminobutyrate--2-oxoglutarate transaminase [Gordonia sp. (in: high G+C Gram-positive bacteria)]HRC51720.1 4-aminobutyrate--2-oxoglutarate transaminase [Gordonia sp. (in: high G+C Gram-positive bacteria)]